MQTNSKVQMRMQVNSSAFFRYMVRAAIGSLLAVAVVMPTMAAAQRLVLDEPQTAGIAGFRTMWDIPVALSQDGAVHWPGGEDAPPTAIWLPEWRKTDGAPRINFHELLRTSLADVDERIAGVERPGALAFDAIHRKLLVRFPGAAEAVAERLAAGATIEKVELVLPFRANEFHPTPGEVNFPGYGYQYRMNWGVEEMWREVPAQWHAVAWPLRRPWIADPEIGPTYNAYIRGAGYWRQFGAGDEAADRFPNRLGPTEVSHENPEGRMDVTAIVTDDNFGETLGERLRSLESHGFLVKKLERYDHRFYISAYEWATGTGGRAILINQPRLEVTFADGPAMDVNLPAAVDVRALAQELAAQGGDGAPTATLPSDAELAEMVEQHRPQQGAWMADWQWGRVQDLLALSGEAMRNAPAWWQHVPNHIRGRIRGMYDDPHELERAMYAFWVDMMISRQPRGWYGFDAGNLLLPLYAYPEAMPAPALTHWERFWHDWLRPERQTADTHAKRTDPNYVGDGEMVHPMADDPRVGGPDAQVPNPREGRFDSYYAATGDWRGNKSFFRSGFNYTMGTQNFNTMAAMAALLGGSFIDSEYAIADGRHGMHHWALGTWSWLDGSTQEDIDHYYLGHSLSAQKVLQDALQQPFDQLIGQSTVAKTMELLLSTYHPGLRRIIASSSRTSLEHVLATQEGLYAVLHTLSPSGVLRDLDADGLPGGMPVLGNDFPADKAGRQSLTGPWAPTWVSEIVDNKPMPFRMTATFTQWGGHREHPLWRRAYMSEHYGIASTDVALLRIQNMAQWRRNDHQVESMRELGTLLPNYGVNETQFANDAHGWIAPLAAMPTLHHDNVMIITMSPLNNHFMRGRAEQGVSSLQSSLALFNYEAPEPSWRIFIDGQPIGGLPVTARQGQRITIHDGVTYLGIIPLPATDLGRDREVVLDVGPEQEFGGRRKQAALVIHSYNLHRGEREKIEDVAAVAEAYGGFIVEFGDATQHDGFEAFQRHFHDARWSAEWNDAEAVFEIAYDNGIDALDMGAKPGLVHGGTSDQAFSHRSVNGDWPYLAEGVERDSSVSLHARTGEMEKNGVTLRLDEGRDGYLLVDPNTGSLTAMNPMPEMTHWSLATADGVEIEADGRVSIMRVEIEPAQQRVQIAHAFGPDQAEAEDAASVLTVVGLTEPKIELNGEPLDVRAVTDDAGRAVHEIPLR